MIRIGFSMLTLGAALASMPDHTLAQDADADQLKKQLTELKETLTLQKDVIAAQKDLVDAQTSLFAAKLPTLPKGKEGAISFESGSGDVFHSTVQAYNALNEATRLLCRKVNELHPEVNPPKPKTAVALIAGDELRLASQYRLVRDEAAALQSEYDAELKPEPRKTFDVRSVPLLPAAGLIASTLVDLSKLFRTDRKFFFSSPTLAATALPDQLAECLSKSKTVELLYAAVELENALASDSSELMANLRRLSESDLKLNQLINLVASKGNSATPFEAMNLSRWRALSERFQNFKKGLEGTDAGSKLTIMLAALQGEAADKMLRGAKRLTVSLATQGGTTLVTSSTFRSDRLYTSGGVVVAYRLTEGNSIEAAGTLPVETKFEEFKKVDAGD